MLNFVKRYLLPRLIAYFLVIFVGVTMIFIIPRLLPTDPILQTITRIRASGTYMDPEATQKTIETLKQLYGLEGSPLQQYFSFWGRIFKGDFGPSYFQFPTPVIQLIRESLPWTFGLLFTTTILSWLLGNILGGFAGYFSNKKWVKTVDFIAMIIRPMPYYILALGLLILFAYIFPIFPLGGGYKIGMQLSRDWTTFLTILRYAFLPSLSLLLINTFVWFQAMKLVVQNVKTEDFVKYAQIGGINQKIIARKYVIRNAMLPQITGLGLALGQIFGGALITEIVFSYPGLGTLIYNAIFTGDYNLLMGITSISILFLSTTILIIDLLYPLFDPRVRYR